VTAAVLWKEYRQQRAVWLAIAILGVLLVVLLAAVMGNGNQWEVFQDRQIRGLLNAVVFCLVVTYGLVSGALLLAGELDEGTMVFLDSLTGQRAMLWARKCVVGALFTLFLSVLLAGMAVGLGFTFWRTALVLPLLGLNALAWGLLAGALCRTVLTAVLTGIALMAASWFWSLLAVTPWDLTLVEGVAALGAGYGSRRIFCREDRSRQPEQRRDKIKQMLTHFPADLQCLLWLIVRQGRWALVACLAGALLLGFTIKLAPAAFWPTVTLLLGVTLGLAAFAPDQNDRNRFLGSQRFPPGRLWAAKVIFWGLAAVVLTALAWFVATVVIVLIGSTWGAFNYNDTANLASPSYWIAKWLGDWYFGHASDAALLAGIWSLYGFCFGQFFGQLARRPVIAAILAVFIAAPIACLWVPSLLVGGVPVWQVFILPIIMLVTTRLTLRPWLAGRLWDARPLLAICGVAALMVVSLAGCLWYRALEVPDVGEPFDVKAFLASLPTPEQNQAGPMIRHAALAMEEHRQKVRLGWGKGDLDLADGGQAFPRLSLRDVLEKGWPQRDEEIGRWLDQVFEGGWVKEARKAAELPLGMVEDPRQASWGQTNSNTRADYEGLVDLFSARALQLQARGDPRAALNHLDTALAPARHVKNYATHWLLQVGQNMEKSALTSFQFWLEKLSPDRELLQAALAMLQRHEAGRPNLSNSLKATYVVHRNEVEPPYRETVAGTLQFITSQVPWEKERQTRIMHALALGALQLSQKPGFNGSAWRDRSPDIFTTIAARTGLPPLEGPGSRLSARQWGEFVEQSRSDYFWSFNRPLLLAARSEQWVHGAQLVAALALYQVDHGKPPAKLEDIVPNYLASLPNDPFTDGPFQYRIAKDRETVVIGPSINSAELTVVPGQALLWSGSERDYFVVPFWKK
jgi:hypothetical protein